METENYLFVVAAVFLAAAVFLGLRLLKSPVWKQKQLRKAAGMASQGKIEKMIEYLEANRNRKSAVCPLTNALVFYFIRSGENDRAEKVVLDAIGAGDTSGTAFAQMAYIAQQKGENETAETYYRQAMERDPNLKGTVNVNLAGLFINMDKNLDEAESLLEEALELRDGAGKSGVYLNLAMLHMKRKQYSRAKASAVTSAELLPDSPVTRAGKARAFSLAARCSIKLDDKGEAKRLASKALKILDNQPGAEKLKQELLAVTGEKTGAVR
jgi:Tfp pilus assembly protein PilF